MAHAPERPEEFVCQNCQAVYAGTPLGEEFDELRYEAPAECSACGGTGFIEIEMYAETMHES